MNFRELVLTSINESKNLSDNDFLIAEILLIVMRTDNEMFLKHVLGYLRAYKQNIK